jgi:peptidylprolyl isomerase
VSCCPPPHTHKATDGLRFLDTDAGRGAAIAAGDRVTVHFDCVFRGIDAVSSRYARTLGGNRTIAEVWVG